MCVCVSAFDSIVASPAQGRAQELQARVDQKVDQKVHARVPRRKDLRANQARESLRAKVTPGVITHSSHW